ncbi:probable G-protein coupled receptor 88 [Astyanax mexicanus]|uniref:G protein-coupled receptor 88 n=2 Tax=Astyanax mexicanus TaxID=7994 RepID=A0A8B9LCA7_ASTMX|nr:probable G-protein coupled receptor 88 [Astyanax mexicanus]KAG9266639.1 putative G-protein coupled receptor 88 [Astyanax mexicanus]
MRNHSSSLSPEDCLHGRAARLSLAAAYALLCAGGLALNLSVVCVVGGFRKLRTASNAFIVNGCVADLLVCAVWMPQEAVAVSTGGGVGPPALRALREALLLLGITVSLLSHSLIAVNRYVLITKSPGTYQALYQKRHTEWMIAGSWLISLASLLPWITGFGSRLEGCSASLSLSSSASASASPSPLPSALASAVLSASASPSLPPPTSSASVSPASGPLSASATSASPTPAASGPPPASSTTITASSASFTMGIPLLTHPPSAGTLALTILGQTAVVLYCYFKIFRRVQSSVKRVSVLNFQLVNSLPCAFPRKDRRLGLCVLAVCFVFLLTTQPLCWTLAAAVFTRVPGPLWTFSWLLFCTVFVSNPFLYTWKNEEFRRSLRCVVRGELWRGSTVGVEPSTVSSISHLLPRQSSRRAFLSQAN